MFVVLYRWRIKPDASEQFVENWTTITKFYLEKCGSFGSRLHKGSDGLYYGYAQWPDALAREKAVLDVRLELAGLHMKDAVEETLPEIMFEILQDHLIHPSA